MVGSPLATIWSSNKSLSRKIATNKSFWAAFAFACACNKRHKQPIFICAKWHLGPNQLIWISKCATRPATRPCRPGHPRLDQSFAAIVPMAIPVLLHFFVHDAGRNRSGCDIYVANQRECELKMAAIIARGADINKTELQQRRDPAKKMSCCRLCWALFKMRVNGMLKQRGA